MTRARTRLLLGVATLTGALLILNHGDLDRLLPRERRAAERVEDRAGLFSALERQGLARYHAALLEGHDIDYRVLTTNGSGEINLEANRYFDDAGVGALSRSGRGLLLVIDGAHDRVRLEVSTSLEGVYTDAFVAYVQGRQMVPFFRTRRVADGILATTELIVARAREAELGEAFLPPMAPDSMGGGATTRAEIGSGADAAAGFGQETRDLVADGLEPLAVVDRYHEALARRDARVDLGIYSEATREMLAGWTMTAAQMDHAARTYARCAVDAARVGGDLAVVRYRVEERQCAPYFLRREGGAWKLDLTVMTSAIGFNHENEWRFRAPIPTGYAFAFDDWRFDGNGFPHAVD